MLRLVHNIRLHKRNLCFKSKQTNMKTFESLVLIVLLLILAAVINSANAQLRHDPGPFKNQSQETKLKGMGIGGGVVVATGATLAGYSTRKLVKFNHEKNEPGFNRQNNYTGVLAPIGIIIGTACMAGGATLIVISHKKYNRLQDVSLQASGESVGLVYRF